MGEEYAKKTRDTLGKIIKKPPLTDKLLGKPPFRFLHDITTEVIRTTGFLNGLFTPDEMDSRNVSVKEDKMEFLRKIIDVVSIVYGDQLSARPSKIVAGQEPEKTNELLQAMAKCIKKNLSSDDAVQQVLTGKKPSKVQEKPPSGSSKRKEGKENRERSDDQRRKKRDRDEDKHGREKSSDRRRRSASKDGRERSHDKEEGAGEGNDEKERRGHQDKSHEKDRNREDRSKDRREERRERKESKPKLKESGRSTHKGLDRKTSSTRKLQISTSQEKKQETQSKARKHAEKEMKDDSTNRKKKSKREEERQEQEDLDNSERKEEEQQGQKPEADEDGTERPSGSGRPPRPASAKGHRRRPAADKSSRQQVSHGQDANPPDTRSRAARPPSARPAAPRVRQRPDPAEEEIARMESAGRHRTAPIIIDSGSRPAGEGISSSDEDEQFLVQEEDEIQPPDMGKLSPVTNGDVTDETGGEEHGGLVRKILETKKELETSASKGANVTGKKRTEIERAPVNEAQRRKEREVVMRDIEKLRSSVQKLCRSAVPLGKIIDYIQEDMDSMQNELLQWKRENKEHAAKLKEEESVTTKTIEPLQAELQELDRSISAQMDMIAASKCNVIRNQEKIDKMIAGVTARS